MLGEKVVHASILGEAVDGKGVGGGGGEAILQGTGTDSVASNNLTLGYLTYCWVHTANEAEVPTFDRLVGLVVERPPRGRKIWV